MNVLITAGPTREPIDPVRYIGNRSSGAMGVALAEAAEAAGHSVTLIAGPLSVPLPTVATRIQIETAQQMMEAVGREFAQCDLLIMAAAVADYRPRRLSIEKLARQGELTIECEPTPDIVASMGQIKKAHQRIVGFSLESSPDLARVRGKLQRKGLDLIVYNPTATMESGSIEPILLYPDGRTETFPSLPKREFAARLIERAIALFPLRQS